MYKARRGCHKNISWSQVLTRLLGCGIIEAMKRASVIEIRAAIAAIEARLYAPETPREDRADLSLHLSELRWQLGRKTGRGWTVDAAMDTPEEDE